MRASAVITLVLAVASAPLSGCALGISGPRPHASIAETPKCDTGRGAVFADGVLAALAGAGGIALASDGETGAGVALLAVGGLFVASAVRGNNNAKQCEEAMTAHDMYVQQIDLGPQNEQRAATLPRPRPGATTGAPAPAATAPATTAAAPAGSPTPAAGSPAAGRPPATATPSMAPISPFGEDAPPAAPAETDWSAFWELIK